MTENDVADALSPLRELLRGEHADEIFEGLVYMVSCQMNAEASDERLKSE